MTATEVPRTILLPLDFFPFPLTHLRIMEKLDCILKDFVAIGNDTKNKIIGASFIVSNKDGMQTPCRPAECGEEWRLLIVSGILYQGAAGRVGIARDSPPFTMASSGWVASMTKIVTATSLMQIIERGAIQL